MAFTEERAPKWGCLVGPAIVAPFAFIWFIGNVLSGGGCEGDPDLNCTPDFRPMWIGLVFLAVTAALIARAINWLLQKRFDQSE